jgi:hypothetical protein
MQTLYFSCQSILRWLGLPFPAPVLRRLTTWRRAADVHSSDEALYAPCGRDHHQGELLCNTHVNGVYFAILR